MVDSSQFQSYLQEICRRYKQWWTENALTETIAARQATFSFEQMVQTEEKDSEGKSRKIPPLSIFKAIQDYIESEPILLVGSPGVGKSAALLRCLIYFSKAELKKPKPRIPVLVRLKRYKSDQSSTGGRAGILTLIRDELKLQLCQLRPRPKIEISDVEELLNQERLILLLDGLNEMPADTHRTHLIAFREEYDQIPLICTGRKLDGGDLGIKRKLEIQSLGSTEINRFLQECLPDQKQKASQLLNRDNRELSRTPFVLWMLYDLFQEQGTEVKTLGEAFRQFFRSFSKDYKEDAPVSEKRRGNWNRWLEHLAFTMLSSPEPTDPGLVISDEQAGKILIEKFGDHHDDSSRIEELLKYHLLERGSGKEISFHHQLIQEYYAAECLLTKLPELLKNQPDQKYTPFQTNYLNYLKWTEAIALMLGFLGVSEHQAKHLVELALDIDLMLGARLAGEVKIEAQEKTIKLVENLDVTILVKISLLEKTQSSQAVSGLRDILNHSESDIRRRAAWALRKMPWDVVFSLSDIALKDLNPEVRENVIWALGESENDYAIPILNTVLEKDLSSDVRLRIVYALQRFANEEAILGLLKATRDSDRNVKSMAAYALEKLDRQKLITVLDKALDSESVSIQLAAIKMLERLGTETVIPYLSKAILDLNQAVHLEATHSLQSVRNKIAAQLQRKIESARINQDAQRQRENEACISDLKAINPVQRGNAIQRLVSLIGRDAISIVIKALDDPDGYVQFSACNILTSRIIRQFPEETETLRKAVPKLIKILNEDKEPRPKAEAASALGQLGDENACLSLSKAMRYEEPSTRRNVIEAFVKLGCQEVEVELLKALKDTDSSVQSFAIKALGEIQCKESISELISLIEDADILVRSSICEALGQFQGDVASEYLPKLIELTATNAGEQSLYAIAAIQSRCGFYNYDIAQAQSHQSRKGRIEENLLHNKLDTLTQEVKKVSEEPKRVIHTQNYFEKGTHTHAHNYANDETLKQRITDLRQLVSQLQQNHQPTTEAEAIQVFDVELHTLQRTNPNRWETIRKQLQLLKHQLLNPERHLTASKAAIAEVAKHYLEDSVLAKALITYVDTMSADTDQGK